MNRLGFLLFLIVTIVYGSRGWAQQGVSTDDSVLSAIVDIYSFEGVDGDDRTIHKMDVFSGGGAHLLSLFAVHADEESTSGMQLKDVARDIDMYIPTNRGYRDRGATPRNLRLGGPNPYERARFFYRRGIDVTSDETGPLEFTREELDEWAHIEDLFGNDDWLVSNSYATQDNSWLNTRLSATEIPVYVVASNDWSVSSADRVRWVDEEILRTYLNGAYWESGSYRAFAARADLEYVYLNYLYPARDAKRRVITISSVIVGALLFTILFVGWRELQRRKIA